MYGQMAVNMMACGKTITCTEEVSTHGRMAVNMRENISMIANMDLVFTHGKMADSMKDTGTMVNNMEREYIAKQMELKDVEDGKKANVCNGSKSKVLMTKTDSDVRIFFK
jgi:mannose/fructose-specific phosphotransferase system component IIA